MLSKSVRSFAILAALFGGITVLPLSVSAQSGGTADSLAAAGRTPTVAALAPVSTAELALMGGPRIAPAGVIRLQQIHPLGGIAQSRGEGAHVGAGSNLALMGTGAAAVVVGLMIGGSGGNAVAVGGGVLGLVGLYRYIR